MINAHLSMSSQRSCTQKTKKYQRKKQRQVLPSRDRPDRKNVREKMFIQELGYILQERDFVKNSMQRVIFHFSVLSVFQIVKFKNGDCPASDGNRGVCFTGQQFLLHRDIIMKIKDVLNDKILYQDHTIEEYFHFLRGGVQ